MEVINAKQFPSTIPISAHSDSSCAFHFFLWVLLLNRRTISYIRAIHCKVCVNNFYWNRTKTKEFVERGKLLCYQGTVRSLWAAGERGKTLPAERIECVSFQYLLQLWKSQSIPWLWTVFVNRALCQGRLWVWFLGPEAGSSITSRNSQGFGDGEQNEG